MGNFKLMFQVSLCLIANGLQAEIPANAFKLFPPMNEIYHPVSTNNEEAQKNFDRGLTYIFAFNHDIAFRSFENAANLDPSLAMAYWGMALAIGQNINADVTPENELRAYNYIQRALQLKKNATPMEQDYIQALATRYTNDIEADLIPLRYSYKNAMQKLSAKYPEDLDARTLYAESILDLDPWKWWTKDGKANPGTYDAIDALEFVLMRNPDHIGANHYYIHAMEESKYPERALMSAYRLENLLVESGHLLHMPSHIFLIVGDYERALKANKRAIAQDVLYIEELGLKSGRYPMHYLTHNLSVLKRVYMLMEDESNAINTAFEIVEFIKQDADAMQTMAYHLIAPLEVYLYFNKWNEILNFKLETDYLPAVAYLHYARAMAYAHIGNLSSAKQEKERMLQVRSQFTGEQVSNNPAANVIGLTNLLLDAAISNVAGFPLEAIDSLKKAVAAEDKLTYDEPPPHFMPARLSLGFALLKEKQFKEAEVVFNEGLKDLQRNGRLLSGLFLSLKGQGRDLEAYYIERELKAALKNASSPTSSTSLQPICN